ncbi:MAG: hypothetical protein QM831_19050 [Kofleriaceae bacterium]
MLRWFSVMVLLVRVVHADCDVSPVAQWALRLGIERVFDRADERPPGPAPDPYFWTIGGHVELGPEWECNTTRVRVSFASSLQDDIARLQYRSYDVPRSRNDLKLSFGLAVDVLVADPWSVHVGAEKIPDFGFQIDAGVRLRTRGDMQGVTGLDLVLTTPECDGCSSTAIGVMATGGFDGHGALPIGTSIALYVLSTLIGGALFIATRPQ